MKVLLALAAGYVLGARAGKREFDDLVSALQALRSSDEMQELLTALRSHASHSLRELADVLEGNRELELSTDDLVERVRSLVGR